MIVAAKSNLPEARSLREVLSHGGAMVAVGVSVGVTVGVSVGGVVGV